MEKIRDAGLLFFCGLAILACVAIIPGWIFLVIHFAPVWIPFVEAHLILKVLVILYGVGGGVILINQVVTALQCWVRDSNGEH